MNNIYIISYKRAELVRTYEYFNCGKIVVPKSQEKDYREKYGNAVLAIPDHLDGAECKKRNAVIDLIKKEQENGIGWVFDDDLLYIKRKKENIKLSGAEALEVMELLESMLIESQITFGGFDYTEDCMKLKDMSPFSLTKFFCQAVCIDTRDGLRYDEKMKYHGDLEYWVQKMNTNRRVLKWNQYGAICYGKVGGGGEDSVIAWNEKDRKKAHLYINAKYGKKITVWNRTRWEYKVPIKGA